MSPKQAPQSPSQPPKLRPPKLRPPDLGRIRAVEPEWSDEPVPFWWRIHTTVGAYRCAWDEFRRVGPLPDRRFEPHPTPAAVPPGDGADEVGVIYVAAAIPTCLAEIFWETRTVVPEGKDIAGFAPARKPRLLDLTGGWPLLIGAAASLNGTDDKETTSAWARALRAVHPDADGVLYRSALDGGFAAALFDPRAGGVLPDLPDLAMALSDPAFAEQLGAATAQIGFDVG